MNPKSDSPAEIEVGSAWRWKFSQTMREVLMVTDDSVFYRQTYTDPSKRPGEPEGRFSREQWLDLHVPTAPPGERWSVDHGEHQYVDWFGDILHISTVDDDERRLEGHPVVAGSTEEARMAAELKVGLREQSPVPAQPPVDVDGPFDERRREFANRDAAAEIARFRRLKGVAIATSRAGGEPIYVDIPLDELIEKLNEIRNSGT